MRRGVDHGRIPDAFLFHRDENNLQVSGKSRGMLVFVSYSSELPLGSELNLCVKEGLDLFFRERAYLNIH